MEDEVDVTFDFRDDSNGEDPDSYSRTLNRYHKILWAKILPNGKYFDLIGKANSYGNNILISECYKESQLSSDTMNTGYIRWTKQRGMGEIIKQIPQHELAEFAKIIYTIGNFIIFPCNRIDGKPTINSARGFNSPCIEDRFDLTLECIRLYYKGIDSPLYDTLVRYKTYFDLFVDFKGYCEFFLLDDLVSNNYSEITPFLKSIDFSTNPCPSNVDEYYTFIKNVCAFIQKRNKRIYEYSKNRIS